MNRHKPWVCITISAGGLIYHDRFETEEEAVEFEKKTIEAGRPLKPLVEWPK
jgi:hypothetical protein